MTFDNLKEILIKERIDPFLYDICDKCRVKGYDGYVIKESKQGYDLLYMERGQYSFVAWFSNQHETSIAFLQEFIRNGNVQLQKYIQ